MKKLLPILLALVAPGCATWGPTWSELSGERYNVTIVNRRPAIIERVDDTGAFPTRPIRVEPGRHRIELSAPAPGWTGGSRIEAITLDFEPCKRYYLNAQFGDPLKPNFTPVVDYVESISGCTVPVAAK
jgi:hypothetical protein